MVRDGGTAGAELLGDVAQAAEIIAQLRAEGQCVVIDYGIESNASRDVTSRLVAQDGKWVIVEQA